MSADGYDLFSIEYSIVWDEIPFRVKFTRVDSNFWLAFLDGIEKKKILMGGCFPVLTDALNLIQDLKLIRVIGWERNEAGDMIAGEELKPIE